MMKKKREKGYYTQKSTLIYTEIYAIKIVLQIKACLHLDQIFREI